MYWDLYSELIHYFWCNLLVKVSYKAFMESRGGEINCFMRVNEESLCEEAWIQGRVEDGEHFCSVSHPFFLYSLMAHVHNYKSLISIFWQTVETIHWRWQSMMIEWVLSLVSCVRAHAFIQSCPTLCNSMDCSLPGNSVHSISQARMLEWLAISYSRGSSHSEIEPASLMSSALVGGVFITNATWKTQYAIR